ncbi:ROK family protein [Phenylobacterium sp.]|uniref:ROK family protein n=1 Tax=Phenylobacterium sp. TaxID=1871053 RepID=UPI002F402284
MAEGLRIGVDFGGTKIEVAALNAGGDFLNRRREANPKSYEAAIETVVRLVAEAEREAGGEGTIGVGSPGSVSPLSGKMRNANSTYLNGRAFKEDLEAALGRPIRLANDANCLALSEAIDGAAAGAKVAFAVIIGTGCGGGLAVDGKLIDGASGIAGEWGHNPLPWPGPGETPGPKCWCGLHGCLETWISGTGLERDHAAVTGETLVAEKIIAKARAGDPEAALSFDRYIDRLGRAVAMICNILDPDVFAFGGGMSKVEEIYPRLPAAISPFVFSDGWLGRLAPARWGDSSGVRGAARLWEGP